ncbi:hypothetical protein ADU59_06620 [Pararhizobium polonicum]|uniref:Uncharacterized protein n=1 Tax=Pararhizobium polonicum TaxID=1612624 RepID=A0A1C7P4C3_9HYPH|nr:hypothetical protein [Pararhizobium polonicum]OBZ96047.1 hypothetical protein ADU59_06620 [Pararhizobium polonicum]
MEMGKRPLRYTASLRSFLLSGELGPLSLGLTMLEISALLGPPDWWVTDAYDEPVPLYWGYSRHLEIGFAPEPPYRLQSLKLRNLPPQDKKFVGVCRTLRVAGDCLHEDMTPAQVLRKQVWNCDDVTVGVCQSWNPVIDICTPSVRLVWSMDSEDERSFEALSGLSDAQKIAVREQLSTGFFGVYSLARPKEDRVPQEAWEDFTPAEFLALIDEGDYDPRIAGVIK